MINNTAFTEIFGDSFESVSPMIFSIFKSLM